MVTNEMAANFGDYNVENEIVESWKREQIKLKTKLIATDHVDWGDSPDNSFSRLKLIGGVDISFPKGDNNHACACLVVLTYPELEVVYQDLAMVHLTSPYVPEFLAFREVEFLVDLISTLKKQKPEVLPQVILVDGNGLLHPRGFGIACHLGVLTDLPTVGVAKTLFHVDGIERDSKHAAQIKNRLKKSGDSFPLVGCSGITWGMALKSTVESWNPIYISVGHKIGLKTAVNLTHSCCQYRVPEPIRQADMRSREYLRKHYGEEMEKCTCRKQHNSVQVSSDDTTHPMKEIQNSKIRAQTDDDKTLRDQVEDQTKKENILRDCANDTFQRLDDLKISR